jgi:hypothetical protein
VAPFHPLRHEARVVAARALASVATFFVVACVLLAGSAGGPLANAEATAPTEPGLGSAAPAAAAAPAAQAAEAAAPAAQAAAPAAEAAAPAAPAAPAEVDASTEATPPEPTPAPEPAPTAAPPSRETGSERRAVDPGRSGEAPPNQGEEPVEEVPLAPTKPPRGGGAKDDPSDPEKPATPPSVGRPEPAPDPGPAPSGNGDGSGWGKPGVGRLSTPAPSGAGKPDIDELSTPVPTPAPSGNSGNGGQRPGSQPSTPLIAVIPELPVGPAPSTPIAPGTLSEAGSNPGLERRSSITGTLAGSPGGTGGGTGDAGGTSVGGAGGTSTVTAPGATLGATAAAPLNVAAIISGGDADPGANAGNDAQDGDTGSDTEPVAETFGVVGDFADSFRYLPDYFKVILAVVAALAILFGLGYLLTMLRSRRLDRQRTELLKEVGLLQTALLPPVPERVGALRTSVAYRPADGPGAGGDFYDVLPLAAGRVGFILGDVSGHGRGALARTAFMRYTLRAYLEAGLEPRVALQVAGRVIDENLGGDFATVLLAVHDPETGSLTYASAGHPAPIVVGPQPHEPVTAGSSPPIGVGVRTGLRQTTVPLVPGAVAALFTDGLTEARVDGGILGRQRLQELLGALGRDATAAALIASVRREARVQSDDIAAVVVQPTDGATAGLFRTEQLELTARELDEPMATRFLESCGLPNEEIEAAIHDARELAERFGGVILHVVFGNRLRVEVLPRNVESIEAASRRVSARP